ncbi:MAG: hypothetical protein ABSG40_20325, partial [Terriglobales bacterium]
IAQKARDSHFPTAATTAGLGLHFQCLDERPQGYILKWLDAWAAKLRLLLTRIQPALYMVVFLSAGLLRRDCHAWGTGLEARGGPAMMSRGAAP